MGILVEALGPNVTLAEMKQQSVARTRHAPSAAGTPWPLGRPGGRRPEYPPDTRGRRPGRAGSRTGVPGGFDYRSITR